MNPIWLQKAEHAIRTDQPNLAMLYMRRGLSETPEGRAWLAQRDAMKLVVEIGQTILHVYTSFAQAVLDAYSPLSEFVRRATSNEWWGLSHADFTLIPDPEAGE